MTEAFEPFSFKKSWDRSHGVNQGGDTNLPFRKFSFSDIINRRNSSPEQPIQSKDAETEAFVESITQAVLEDLNKEKPAGQMSLLERQMWARSHGFDNP